MNAREDGVQSSGAPPAAAARGASPLAWIPVVIAVLVSANTIPGDFVFDDELICEQDEGLKSFSLARIFADDYWGTHRVSANYRPLTLLTYALNLAVSESPWGFHLVNVVLSAAVAGLAFVVLRRLTGDARIAAICASLYAVLPIHVEAVANVVGRAELLAAAAVLGAWALALDRDGKFRSDRRAALAVGVVTFAGLLAKENTAVVCGVLVATAFILRQRIPWSSGGAAALAVGVYFALRWLVIDETSGRPSLVDNSLAWESEPIRALNAISLLGRYFIQSVAPLNFSADYSYNQIPVRALSDVRLWLAAVGTIGAGALVAAVSWRRVPLVACAAAFYFIAFSPTANVFFPIGTIYGERLAFLPSFALAIGVAGIGSRLAASRSASRGYFAVLAVLCIVYGVQTVARNAHWSDRESLYLAMPEEAPESTRSQLKAAQTTLRRAIDTLNGKRSGPESAEQLFKRAEAGIRRSLAIYPEHGRAMATLGELYVRSRRPALAIDALTKAIELLARTKIPEPAVFRLRAEANLHSGKPAESIADVDRYVAMRRQLGAPPDAFSHHWRGLSLAYQKRTKEALAEFERALALEPEDPGMWTNRGYCRFLLGDHDGAVADYQKGIEICTARGLFAGTGDTVAGFWQKIAEVRRAQGDTAGAEAALTEAKRAAARR